MLSELIVLLGLGKLLEMLDDLVLIVGLESIRDIRSKANLDSKGLNRRPSFHYPLHLTSLFTNFNKVFNHDPSYHFPADIPIVLA